MTVKITYVITDCGDGSNSVRWVIDPAVLEKMEELAEEGDETYASGDGLQARELTFAEGFDIQDWLKVNHLHEFTMNDFY